MILASVDYLWSCCEGACRQRGAARYVSGADHAAGRGRQRDDHDEEVDVDTEEVAAMRGRGVVRVGRPGPVGTPAPTAMVS
jgi:hypothetical protein